MRLYVTPLGRWLGTQADAAAATREEGSKPGSWKAVEVPTDKANLLLFLNKGWKAPTVETSAARSDAELLAYQRPKLGPNGAKRFRVFFKGLFAGVLLADNQADAEAAAAGLLSVRRSLGA